jgi:hypothetical protein
MILKRKHLLFFKEILNNTTRMAIIERYIWKILKIVSPIQINLAPFLTWMFFGRGRLPSSKQRILETDNPCDDFIIKDLSIKKQSDKTSKVNLIFKGISDEVLKKIDKNLVSYIVNMEYDKRFFNFKCIVQVSCDHRTILRVLKNKNLNNLSKNTKIETLFLSGDGIKEDEIKENKINDTLENIYSSFHINKSVAKKKEFHIAAMTHKINIENNAMGTGVWVVIYLLSKYKL